LSPGEDLVYRPLSVLVPFGLGQAARYPIKRIAEDTGARWIRDSVEWVDLAERMVHTTGEESLRYDALLLAPGAQERKAIPHVSIFTDRTFGQTYRGIVDGVDAGAVQSLVLIEPVGPSWPLPLYELALLTAKHARDRRLRLDIVVVTPRPYPLYAFGEEIGERVEMLLREAGIALYVGTRTHVESPGRMHLEPGDLDLQPDRIVTLPTMMGPNVRGVPGEAIDRFIPVDNRCRVLDTDGHVFAAGDATDLPLKHGSLAAQQADTAAAGVAHLAGVAPAADALPLVLRSTLLTGNKPLYLEAHLVAGTSWRAQIHDEPPWGSDQLVVADELGPYLANLSPDTSANPTAPQQGHT
jgi:sulfide:quinone oxidoreductase